MARPKLKISEKEVENYSKLGASNREIAQMLGCDEGTIRKRFSAILTKSRALRKTMLRKFQWDAAKNGNSTILVWLGKNELGQSDAVQIQGQVEHTGAKGGPIQVKAETTIEAFDHKGFAERFMQRYNTAGSNGGASGRTAGNGQPPAHGNGH